MAATNLPPLKILMLHGTSLPPNLPNTSIKPLIGYAQSGPTFYAKTRSFQKYLLRTFLHTHYLSFSYPTAPHCLLPAEHPSSGRSEAADPTEENAAENFGWWRRTSDSPIIYTGISAGLDRVAETIRAEGPFDGVIGFSQGGALVALVASALEADPARHLPSKYRLSDDESQPIRSVCPNGVVQPPLKFAIIYSGFLALDPSCDVFFEPKLKTPVLHFIGQLDSVVDEARSRRLVAACADPSVVLHVGGHFVPSQRVNMDVLVAFIRKAIGEDAANRGKAEKEGGQS